jgi:hypothetical protein
METTGKKRSGAPYQYKMNNKKIAIADREGFESDYEEIEDLQSMENIEETMHTIYERKIGGPREGTEGKTLILIKISVEPITPCATSTSERTLASRQSNFSGRRMTGKGSSQGESTGGANPRSIS